MKGRVCVVTGTRAEYGLLYWLLRLLKEAPDFDLQLVFSARKIAGIDSMDTALLQRFKFSEVIDVVGCPLPVYF